MKARFAVLLALFGSTPAIAQTQNCAGLADDAARLACYDAAAKAAKTAPAKKTEDPSIVKARTAVQKLLNDPDSARFEDLAKKGDAICGFVNAKNSYGGYGGRTQFIYVISSTETHIAVPLRALTPYNAEAAKAAKESLERYCGFVPG